MKSDIGESTKSAPGKTAKIVWLVIFISATLAAAVLFQQIHKIDTFLKDKTQYGIVAFELSGEKAQAQTILEAWAAADSAHATHVQEKAPNGCISQASELQKRDWFFIIAYTAALCSLAILLSTLIGSTKRTRNYLIVLAFSPAIFDSIGNVGIGTLLDNASHLDTVEAWIAPTAAAAILKFSLFFTAIATMSYLAGYLTMAHFSRPVSGEDQELLKPFDGVIEDERTYLQFRRRKGAIDKDQPISGLSSSGGGIRSATVNLGTLETFLDADFLKNIDYHSTVSGGGYIGSAVSSLLSFNKTGAIVSQCCRNRPSSQFDPQYLFGHQEKPYFDAAETAQHPLHSDHQGINNNDPSPLSREMVLNHFRTFGDFLVRRQRILSRDVLRAVGSILTGITATLTMFLLVVFCCAAIVLFLLSLIGLESSAFTSALSDPLNKSYFTTYVLPGVARGFYTGLAACFILVLIQVLIRRKKVLPESLFFRDGDTGEDSFQSRTLWIFGTLLSISAFGVSLCFPYPAGLLHPAAFMAGCSATALLAYLLCCVSDDAILFFLHGELDKNHRSMLSAVLGLCLALTIILTVIGLLPLLINLLLFPDSGNTAQPKIMPTSVLGLISAILSGIMAWYSKTAKKEKSDALSSASKFVKKYFRYIKKAIFALLVILAFFFVFLTCTAILIYLSIRYDQSAAGQFFYPIAALASFFVLLILGIILDFNKLSLHYFYRDRLVEAYMTTYGPAPQNEANLVIMRDNSEMRLTELHGILIDDQATSLNTKPSPDTEQKIVQKIVDRSDSTRLTQAFQAVVSDNSLINMFLPARTAQLTDRLIDKLMRLGQKTKNIYIKDAATSAPYHLYCTCLNLTTDRDMKLRTRKSDIFIFSKLYCGSKTTSFMPTLNYRRGMTKVARAMTISGAAVDSSLGRNTFFAQSFAATLFNIRLGQWMENPGYKNGKYASWNEDGVFWLPYLLMEALGMSDSRRRLIHLSDGGHTGDNLGLIPLFQRQCGVIIAVDAEADPDYEFVSLRHALRYLDVDTRVHISLDLDHIRPDKATGLCSLPFAIGGIDYLDANGNTVDNGCIIILKAAVTPDMSWQLRKHKEDHPEFPQETTADQFFSEDQFEAYRHLGKEMADILFAAIPSLQKGTLDCHQILQEYYAWLNAREMIDSST